MKRPTTRNPSDDEQNPIENDSPAPLANMPSSKWTRTKTNFVLDCVLMLTFVLLLGITAIVRFVFPPAALSAGWMLWGWPLDGWLSLQFFVIAALMAEVVLHVMLHWNWVCGVIANQYSKKKGRAERIDDGSKTLWGVGFLILVLNVLGILLAIAALTIDRPQ